MFTVAQRRAFGSRAIVCLAMCLFTLAAVAQRNNVLYGPSLHCNKHGPRSLDLDCALIYGLLMGVNHPSGPDGAARAR